MNKTGMDPIEGFNLTRENFTGSVPSETDVDIFWLFAIVSGGVVIFFLFVLGKAWMEGLGESNCSHAI